MNRLFKKIIVLIALSLCLTSLVCAYEMRYPFRDSKGNDKIIQCFENFGAYRKYAGGGQEFHKGIDLSTAKGTKVYPVAAGKIVYIGYLAGSYGQTVIIEHSASDGTKWQSHYSHMKKADKLNKKSPVEAALSKLYASAEASLLGGTPYSVGVSTWIGLEWNTGNSKGHHLHFGVGAPTVFNSNNTKPNANNLLNPITAGLKQPNHSSGVTVSNQPNAYLKDVYYVDPDGKKGIEWKYLDWMPGRKVRIIAEAYDKVAGSYTSAPYKVAFEVTRLWGTYSESHEIKFDDLKNGNSTAQHYNTIYSLEKPKVSQSALQKGKKKDKFYYYWDWEPPEPGYYGIVVEVYDAYWNSGDLKIAMSETKGTTTEGILLGIGGVFHGLSAGEEEKVSVMDTVTSNLAFSPTPDDTDYVNHTVITAAANLTPEAWTAKIYDSSNNLIKEISAGGDRVTNFEWDGTNSSGWAVGSGTYTYQVEAKEDSDVASQSGTIVVDKTQPNFTGGPSLSISTIHSATDIISMSFSADEELDGIGVHLYDGLDNYIGPVMSLPGLKAGETAEFKCYRIRDLPNGNYKIKTFIVDNVGNINEDTKYIDINIPNNDAPSPSFEEPDEEVEDLPDLPSYEARPIISDIAFDSSGNQYVLYGRYNKLVKYNSAGEIVKIINKFDLIPNDTSDDNVKFRLPLGLAVSPSGDRIYVADTYNDRVLIYDEDLNPVKEIKGRDVYTTDSDVDACSWKLGIRDVDESSIYGGGIHYEDWEKYSLPADVDIIDQNVYVVDSDRHRVLKYDKDGNPIKFSQLLADLRSIYREKYNTHYGLWGNTIDKYLVYSNSLNDTIEFDEWDFRHHNVENQHSGSGNGEFLNPGAMAVDSSGNLYIADTGNHRIQKFNSDGSFVSKFGEGELNSPKGIDIDSYGNIWVADAGNQRIVQFDPSGNFVKEYKSDEYTINPQKLVVKDGKIYIADANFSEPLVWNIAGEITNVRVSDSWFSPNSDGEKDSINILYNLSQPADVTIQAIPSSPEGVSAMNSAGDVVLENASRSIGNNEESWAGVVQSSGSSAQGSDDGENNTIADGSYTLKIIASFGDYKKVKTVDVNVDTEKPSLTLNRDPPGISPNGDDVNDEMLIECSVSDNLSTTAEVKMTLYKNDQAVGLLDDSRYTLPITDYSTTWTGQIGSYVMEGNYILELKATDLAGNTETATAEVLVDFQPPRIEAINISNEYFSPNGDARKDNTELSFNLSDTYAKKMFVTVQVENEYGELVTKIAARKELPPGEHSFTWEGNSPLPLGEGLGVRVADGSYSLRIYAEDTAGNLGTAEPVAVVVDTVPPEINEFLAEPNPFTPNNDGEKDATVFNYKLSEPCFANLEIFKENGALFLQRGLYNVTQEDIEWDGRGARGELLGAEYTYTLHAEDRAANIATSEPQVIVVDREPSLIPYAFAEPDPFSAANNDNTNLRYYVSRDNVEVSVSILGRDGAVIKDLVLNEVKDKGEHSIAWFGDYNSGYGGPFSSRDQSKVPDGAYEFKISAYDAYNNANGDNSNTVYVDNTPPFLSIYPVDLDLVNNTATFGYFLPESSSVEVTVHDQDGSLLEELTANEHKEVGEHYVSWNMAGVSPGQNYFKVIAEDSARNRDEKVTEIFSIPAENELAIVNLSASPNPFTPNGDGLTDLTRISYQISGGAPDYTINIDIVTETGATVKTLVENEPQSTGTYSFYWDGKDDLGPWTSDGYYEYVITAVDQLGSSLEQHGSMLIVSTRPTVDISTSLPIFSPNGDSSKDTVTFNYSIDYPVAYITGEALIKLEVLNASSEAVWTKIFNHTAGTYAYEYDGTKDDSSQLPAGDYYVKASAEDALGSTAVPKTVSFTIDYENPVITISEVTPNPFSPDPNGINDETAVAYTVSKDSDVTIQVKDSSGTVIKELQSSERVGASAIRASPNDSPDATAQRITLFTVPTVVWDGKDTSGTIVSDATYEVFVSAIDDAGNTGEAVAEVVVDNNTEYSSELLPIRNIDIQPYYAKEGAAVTIDFSVAEELLSQPVVNVGSYTATYLGSEEISSTRYDYHYSHTIGDDPEGSTNVQIAITDLAGNLSSAEGQIVVDKTDPQVSNLSANPNPATVGEVTISFNVSEALKQAPVVYVTQNGAASGLAAVSGQWSAAGGNVEAKFNVVSGYDGAALITVEATDLANNPTTYQPNNPLTVDTIAPTFTSIQAEIASNPDFNDYAKEGSEVSIRFQTSENLQYNPDVRINVEVASYASLAAGEYTYTYTVDSNDTNGNAAISISGYDFAGNEGTTETSSSAESFVIDLEDPTVAIAYPGSSEIIASPSPFFTNADPDDTTDRPNYTTLRYETSEYGLVTLKVYQVDKTKTADQYTRDDFTGTPVATLIAGSWMSGGVHNYVWQGQTAVAGYDTNSDGYADPGKYAFIVEVRDKAGNLTQRLWGGTVWIQSNVLQLEQPGTIGINPDPLNFSPNGNSVKTTTKFYFKVKLGVSPAAPVDPERIEILALPGDMQWLTGVIKKVGTYTVRVYDSGGSLIRTIEKDSDMYSAADTFVIWDGRIGTGADLLTPGGFAADGDYRLVVEVKDFAGNLAYGEGGGTTLERWVKVDSEPPTITDNQNIAEPWKNNDHAGDTYNVDFSDSGSGLSDAHYKIRRPNGSETVWLPLLVVSGSNLFNTDWSIDFSDTYCHEGTNYVSVKVTDIAGNENTLNDVFYVKKDTNAPSANQPSTSTPTNDQTPTWSWTASSDLSGIQGYYIKVGTSAGGDNVVGETWVGNNTSWTHPGVLSDGIYHATIRAKDGADNIGLYGQSSSVTIDTQPPVIGGLSSASFNPYVDDNVTINFTASDAAPSSGFSILNISAKIKYGANDVKNLTLYDDGNNNYHVIWDGTNDANPPDYENEGNYTLEISASDATGNPATTKTSTITLQDDQYIAQGYDPNIFFDGALFIRWIDGPPDDSQDDPSSPAHASEARDWWDSGWGPWVSFNVDHDQEVRLTLSSGGNVGDQAMQWDVDDAAHTSHTLCDLSNPKKVWMTAGTHQIRAYVAANAVPGHHYSDVYAYFKQRKYNRYQRSCSPDYAKNIVDAGQYQQSGPVEVNGGYPTGPTQVTVNGITHKVTSGSGVYYQRDNSTPVKISNIGDQPAIAADSQDNAYIAWHVQVGLNSQINFQKIPYNFARINNTAQGASIVGEGQPTSIQVTTFEAPTLISPDDVSTVNSLRPTFTWQHRKSSQLPVASYRLDIAKNEMFTIDSQSFTKDENTGSPDKNDPTLYHYTYSIHEFDPGLDRDTYYWRVTAHTTNEAATSEVRSFTVAPELTLTGVTNYPNPFNPNRESTKIRYRLGATADDVKIRIYDVVGSLVKQLDNCPTDGEGSSVWQKYNDVSWDGRNGRGDVVVNGIYPFEVIARLGDKSVSGRGKVAVLK